jgi:hypothetical protein
LIFEPLNTLTTKLCRRIVREEIVKCFVPQKANYLY